MDVTAAESTPRFLWAIENARYDTQEVDPLDGVRRWGGAASGSKNDYDYSDLGMTIAATEIRVTDKRPQGVGVLPGGLGYYYGGDSQGKAFYLFEPMTASVIRKITTTSGFTAPAGRVLGMGIAPVTYINESASVKTKEFFTSDSEGNVLYCDTTDEPASWNLRSIFQLRTTTGDRPVAITKALEVGSKGNERWVFGGTSDLMAPDSSETPERKLTNDEQFIFGLRLTDNPNMDGTVTPIVTNDLTALKYMADGIFPPWSGAQTGDQVDLPAGAKGWHLKLRDKVVHATDPTDPEYVTTSPFLYQGVLMVSTFIPRTRHPDDAEKCPELGDGKLYALDPITGKSAWPAGKQAVVFDNIKIAGISAVDGKLLLGVKPLRPGALDALAIKGELSQFSVLAEGTAISLGALGTAGSGEPTGIEYDIPQLQYWKERF
jgi:outer membrane protein assembly factor BamB